MNLYEYLHQAKRTALPTTIDMDLFHSSCGLQTEVGEVIDIFKRHFFYKKDLSVPDLKKELGDILWYFNLPLFQLFQDDDTFKQVCEMVEEEIPELADNLKKMLSSATGPDSDVFGISTIWGLTSGLSAAALKVNSTYWSFLSSLSDGSESTAESMAAVMQDLVVGLSFVLTHVKALGELYGMTLSEIYETNINKLKVRMPEKFDFEKVLNRDLEAEDRVQ